MKLVLATHNQHKIEEMMHFLRPFAKQIKILTANDFPGHSPLTEDQESFEGNAAAKAWTLARFSHLWTLADDSGLEVDALNGAPGVMSARYANPIGPCDDQANNRKLLQDLQGVPAEKRTARFQCVLALVDPKQKRTWYFTGTCEGRILTAPQGTGGFGYDPLFFFPDLNSTMAALSFEKKNEVSHRARAFGKLVAFLPSIL